MQKLSLIGIGTGDPGHVTRAGVTAMRSVECLLIPEKGEGKDDLAQLRRSLMAELAPDVPVVPFSMPVRDTELPYHDGVEVWHDAIAEAWVAALPRPVSHVGLLVWGDPSLYDSTLRIAARLSPMPAIEVVPGITALQALTAAFTVTLNDVNAPVLITTGRQLRDHGWPADAARVAVMLDGECSFQKLDPAGVTIWWGAYLGLPNQLLRQGPLADVAADIIALRAEARASHGWIMDTYLLERA
ncbi:MAG: precorrin-6A synthase (deacetylating) [Pseudomonadota bacterium]